MDGPAAVDGNIWEWVTGGLAALGFALFGLSYGHANHASTKASEAKTLAEQSRMTALETARAEAIAGTESLRREMMSSIKGLANAENNSRLRIWEDIGKKGRELGDFRVEAERRFIPKDDFKEMRVEIRSLVGDAISAMEGRSLERHNELRTMILELKGRH